MIENWSATVSKANLREGLTFIGHLILGNEETPALRQRLVGALGGVIGLKIAFSGLSFTGTVLLARLLGKEGYGVYTYCFTWIVLIGIPAVLGFDQLLVRDVAVYQSKQQWGLLRGLLRKANVAVLLVSTGAAVLAASIALALRDRLPSGALPTFLSALALLPLITLSRVRQAVMQGLHRVALGAMPEQLIQPALMLAVFGLAYLVSWRLTAPVAMSVHVIASAIAFFAGAWFLRRALPQAVKNSAPMYGNLDLARKALPLTFLAGANVLFGQADTLILGALKGASAVGVYSVAHKGSDLINFILAAQNVAFASTVASLYASGDMASLQRLVTRLARGTLLISAPLGIGLIAFGRSFLNLYGPQFAQARIPLAILSFAQLFNVALGSVGLLLIMTGHERDAANAIATAAAANVALNFALIPRWGTEGASVAYTASLILWNVWMAIALYRRVGIHSTALGAL